jgi:hypothetical protein
VLKKFIAALVLAAACAASYVAPAAAQRYFTGTLTLHVAGSPSGTFVGGIRSNPRCVAGRRVTIYRASRAESTVGPYNGRILPGSINRKVAQTTSKRSQTVNDAGFYTIKVRPSGWYFVKVAAAGRCRGITMGTKVIRYNRSFN